LSPISGIQQKATTGPTTITNKTFSGSLTSGSTVVLKCVSVCVCVCGKGQHFCESFILYIYIYIYKMLCTDYVQVPGNSFFLSCISL
jgi:hypothetical protein